ncbi:MAG TPA: hypothetical protein PLK35_04020 [Candidatus Moranbacteria bacterium]|nr:hypothetical protein [Candidatus Moranbacteria bacterium]
MKVNLFYSSQSKTLSFDKLVSQPVSINKEGDISVLEFVREEKTGNYALAIYDENKEEIIKTEFNELDGAFAVELPYFSLAKELKIFKKSPEKEILSIDLSDLSSCNANDICEIEKRETAIDCIGDCGKAKNNYSPETEKLLKEKEGIIKDPETGEVILKDLSYSPNPQAGFLSTSPNTKSSTETSTQESSKKSNTIIILIISVILLAGIIILAYKFVFKKNK